MGCCSSGRCGSRTPTTCDRAPQEAQYASHHSMPVCLPSCCRRLRDVKLLKFADDAAESIQQLQQQANNAPTWTCTAQAFT